MSSPPLAPTSQPAAAPQAAASNAGLSWPLLIGLAVFALLAGPSAVLALRDPDTYWHLAAGRWMLAHAQIPAVDPFSHSLPGAAWTAHEWLSELLIAGLHRLGGWYALAAFYAAVYGAMLARLMRYALGRMEPVHALLLVVLTAGMTWGHWLARPHVLAWLCLVLWLCELVDASERERRPAWWLLPLMVVWANLHGSFVLGLGLAVAIGAEAVLAAAPATRRAVAARWSLFALLALLSTLVTPHGLTAWTFPVQVMRMSYSLSVIGEWLSPNFQQLGSFEIWLLIVVGGALCGRLRLPLLRTVMLLGLLHLALKHQRNIAILALAAPILCAGPWARQWLKTASQAPDAERLDRVFRALARRASGVATVTGLVLAAALTAVQWHGSTLKPRDGISPTAAVDAAVATGLKGPVWNHYNFGGYLIYRGIPVFIDGRADMYGDDFMRANNEAGNLKMGEALTQLLDKHHIAWTLQRPNTPANALLAVTAGWRQVHADEQAVVFAREP